MRLGRCRKTSAGNWSTAERSVSYCVFSRGRIPAGASASRASEGMSFYHHVLLLLLVAGVPVTCVTVKRGTSLKRPIVHLHNNSTIRNTVSQRTRALTRDLKALPQGRRVVYYMPQPMRQPRKHVHTVYVKKRPNFFSHKHKKKHKKKVIHHHHHKGKVKHIHKHKGGYKHKHKHKGKHKHKHKHKGKHKHKHKHKGKHKHKHKHKGKLKHKHKHKGHEKHTHKHKGHQSHKHKHKGHQKHKHKHHGHHKHKHKHKGKVKHKHKHKGKHKHKHKHKGKHKHKHKHYGHLKNKHKHHGHHKHKHKHKGKHKHKHKHHGHHGHKHKHKGHHKHKHKHKGKAHHSHKHKGHGKHGHHHDAYGRHAHGHEFQASHEHKHMVSAKHAHGHHFKANHKHKHQGHSYNKHKHHGHTKHSHKHKGKHHHGHKHKGNFKHGHKHKGKLHHKHGHHGKTKHNHKHNGHLHHKHGHNGNNQHSHKHRGKQGHKHKHNGHLKHKYYIRGHQYQYAATEMHGRPVPPNIAIDTGANTDSDINDINDALAMVKEVNMLTGGTQLDPQYVKYPSARNSRISKPSRFETSVDYKDEPISADSFANFDDISFNSNEFNFGTGADQFDEGSVVSSEHRKMPKKKNKNKDYEYTAFNEEPEKSFEFLDDYRDSKENKMTKSKEFIYDDITLKDPFDLTDYHSYLQDYYDSVKNRSKSKLKKIVQENSYEDPDKLPYSYEMETDKSEANYNFPNTFYTPKQQSSESAEVEQDFYNDNYGSAVMQRNKLGYNFYPSNTTKVNIRYIIPEKTNITMLHPPQEEHQWYNSYGHIPFNHQSFKKSLGT
ncbi:putative uncharacterized protein DDB_G0282133 [Nilaparvata lugens]|uniref:putative uncharacterized protein DDB_G0282133 n=1 Tax=Nilaparvata lugens TaxID=108931 RepID=UPI00193E6465|nr:putative uncharacterized protein DDB_G0282133 [Nilaparvata lugens]